MADRIVVLDAGRIVQAGAPLDLYAHPASRFVASFIGSPAINLLDGHVEADGSLRLRDGGMLRAPSGARPGPVTVGVRPEDLVPDPAGAIAGRVRIVERLGAETYVLFGDARTPLTWRIPGALAVATGDQMRLNAAPDRLHLFDPETGARL